MKAINKSAQDEEELTCACLRCDPIDACFFCDIRDFCTTCDGEWCPPLFGDFG